MSSNPWPKFFLILVILFLFSACSSERAPSVEALKKQPKEFVGSDTGKQCHLEHFDPGK